MSLRALMVVLLGVLVCTGVQGRLLNSSFEIPDPNRANEYFTPPLHWQWQDTYSNLNYVGLHTEFTPRPERAQLVLWSIPEPVDGDYFVLLSTGDAEGPGSYSKTLYSAITQVISVCPGDVLSGHYFFGTSDYIPYNDTGLIKLIPVDPNDGLRPAVLVDISVQDVGNYGSTDGWQYFRHRVNAEHCGQYILLCEVRDHLDLIFKSYLALDNFRICRGVPDYGDLNFDCAIDFHDFNILAQGWLADCNDPNVIADANIPCDLLIPDPNICDSLINLEHILLMSEHWLEQFD